jgi:hypothetical protein
MAETVQKYAVITTKYSEEVKISDFTKSAYSNIVFSWSPISSTDIDPINFASTPGQCSFVVANNVTINGVSRFSKITGLVFADIKIYQNNILIFWGTVEDLTNINNVDVTVQCVGKDAELSKLFQHTIVDTVNFPHAGIDEIGKMLPVVYGEAKRVPFIGIDIGTSTLLAISLTAIAMTVVLSDSSVFAASGTIEIDNERMTYSTNVNNVLTLSERGVDSTTIAAHFAGVYAREVKDEYIYAIDGAASDIGDIYIGDYKLTSDNPQFGVTLKRYIGDHPTYPGLACIGIKFYSAGWSPGALSRISSYLEKNESLVVYPMNSIPSASPAYDNNPSSCYDSSINGYQISESKNAYSPVKRYVSFEMPIEQYPYEGITCDAHILIDMQSPSSPPNMTLTLNQMADTNKELSNYDDFEESPNDVIIDLSGNSGCPTWHKIPLLDATWCPYITILWDNIEGTEVQIYEIHLQSRPPEDDPPPSECYPPCPYCEFGSSSPIADVNAGTGSSILIDNSHQGAIENSYTPDTPFQWDRVYADVSGKTDGSVIESPEGIISDILSERCGLTITKTCDATGYTEALVIMQKPDVRALLARIAYQAMCISFFTPSAYRLKKMTGTYSTNAVLTYADFFQNQTYLNYTNKSYIVNKIDALFKFYWWGKYNGTDTVSAVDSESPSSQSLYGILQNSDDLPYITVKAQAQDVVDWRLEWLKMPRLQIEIIGTLTNNINRKIGDVVTIDTSNSSLDDMLAELVDSGDQFLITNIVYQPDGAIRITAIGL